MSEFTDIVINSTDEYSLTSKKIDINFWKLLFRASLINTTTYDGIQAIYPVNNYDLKGSKKEICERLYIAQADYDDFKSFYDSYFSTHTIYLFRYQVSDYVSMKATTLERTGWLIEKWDNPQKDSYIFEQTVNLDFDIIDLTFSNDLKKTIIPVVSAPIDVIPPPTPPTDIMDESINFFEPNVPDLDDDGCAKVRSVIPTVLFVIAIIFVIRLILSKSKKKREDENDKDT